jgi:hypothetical protein
MGASGSSKALGGWAVFPFGLAPPCWWERLAVSVKLFMAAVTVRPASFPELLDKLQADEITPKIRNAKKTTRGSLLWWYILSPREEFDPSADQEFSPFSDFKAQTFS